MVDSRRQTRSVGAQRRDHQSDAQFWSRQPDPLLIERGLTAAIQLVRNTVNVTNEAADEVNTRNATTTVPPLVYVDEDGLEEQFLTEDEASHEIVDVTANRVTTPIETADAAPLDPIYTQRSEQEEDLDLWPSRGPHGESLLNAKCYGTVPGRKL